MTTHRKPRLVHVYLLRHGLTVDNVRKVLQGWRHGRLTRKGHEQAKANGRFLKTNAGPVGVIYSSDLRRATQTAAHVRRELGAKTPLHTSALLRERRFGKLQGKPYHPELFKTFARTPATDKLFRQANAETLAQLERRIARFFNTLSRTTHSTIVIVAHEGFNNWLLNHTHHEPIGTVNRKQSHDEIHHLTFTRNTHGALTLKHYQKLTPHKRTHSRT